jgi:hypothetical protein
VVDVFGEVDEQIRADRLHTFIKRAIPAFIAALVLCVLVVVSIEGYRIYRTSQSAKASLVYQDAMDAASKGDDAKAFQQFGDVAKGSGPYKALALMQQGGIRMDEDKAAEAAALFDQAAAAAGKTVLIADIATLKSAYAQLDTAPLEQMVAKLTPLTATGRPYRIQAREALAMARLAAGKTAEAKSDFVAISLLQDTPDSARQRAQAIIALIDSGSAASLKRLEEQAKTAVPIAPSAPSGGPQPADAGAAQVQSEAPQ